MMADPNEIIRKYGGRKLTKKDVDDMVRELGSERDDNTDPDVFKTIDRVNSFRAYPMGNPTTKLGVME